MMFLGQLTEDEKIKEEQRVNKILFFEEKIGIGLDKLLDALIYGAWFKDYELSAAPIFYAKARLITEFEYDVTHDQWKTEVVGFTLLESLYGLGYDVRDYGKTWALTREELE